MLKKKDYEWKITKGRHDIDISLVKDDRILYSSTIDSPYFFLRIRLFFKKSMLKFLYYQSSHSQKGFSLIEPILVLAFFGVIFTIGIYKFTKIKKQGANIENIGNPQGIRNIHIQDDRQRCACTCR